MNKLPKLPVRILLGLSITTLASFSFSQEYQIPRTEWGVPDFRAVWKHASIIPFERPRDLGEKRAYTEAEALAIERSEQERFDADNEPLDPNRPPPVVADSLPPIGNYDLFWRDDAQFIPTIDGEFRTSAIIDPPNGRLPALQPAMMDRLEEQRRDDQETRGRTSTGPEGRSLGERCLVAFGNLSGPVMSPIIYNSHLQIVQSPGYVVIIAEMVHDARIVKITDERNPAAEQHRKWMGDSIGRWEGDTLVVETRYFNPWHRLRGLPVENLTITETFRRESEYKLIYGFTVNDPTLFTAEFTGEYPLSKLDEPIYEYACHEGNYGMVGILAGARTEDVNAESQ
ncbi:MAG: hypothetical protein R3F50_05010 [Gammaproteobacteria bacterium]